MPQVSNSSTFCFFYNPELFYYFSKNAILSCYHGSVYAPSTKIEWYSSIRQHELFLFWTMDICGLAALRLESCLEISVLLSGFPLFI